MSYLNTNEFFTQYNRAELRNIVLTERYKQLDMFYKVINIPLSEHQELTKELNKMIKKEKEITIALKEKNEIIKEKVLKDINTISDPIVQNLFYLKYVKDMNWEQIADKLYISISWAYALRNKFLNKNNLKFIYDEEGNKLLKKNLELKE